MTGVMTHTHHHQKRLLTRVRRIRGQAEGLERALGEGRDCFEVLQQIASMRGAINGLLTEVIEGHVEEHIANVDDEKMRRTGAAELMKILSAYIK